MKINTLSAFLLTCLITTPFSLLADVQDIAVSAAELPSYTNLAGQGNAEAQFKLGQCYQFGIGIPMDLPKAKELYEKAAQQNHAAAYHRLALMSTDKTEAAKLFMQAAELGSPEAMKMMAILYLKGEGVPESKEEAAAWYQRAIEAWRKEVKTQNGKACYELVDCMLSHAALGLLNGEQLSFKNDGKNVDGLILAKLKMQKTNESISLINNIIEICKQGAEAGNADCMWLMGVLREYGIGVNGDEEWYYHLFRFNRPTLFRSDMPGACQWYIKAAENGSILACHSLSARYETGVWERSFEEDSYERPLRTRQVLANDREKAQAYLMKALELGDNSVIRHFIPAPVIEDSNKYKDYLKELTKWNLILAMRGDLSALENLHDVSSNVKPAGGWDDSFHADEVGDYWKKANEGDAAAQYKLGQCYLHGAGVSHDMDQARRWLRIAYANGNAPASYALAKLESLYDGRPGLKWLAHAAAKGYDIAVLEMCIFYEGDIDPVKKDFWKTASFKYAKQKAEQGGAEDKWYLATCYKNAIGVEANVDEAIRWYLAASELGHELSKRALADFHYHTPEETIARCLRDGELSELIAIYRTGKVHTRVWEEKGETKYSYAEVGVQMEAAVQCALKSIESSYNVIGNNMRSEVAEEGTGDAEEELMKKGLAQVLQVAHKVQMGECCRDKKLFWHRAGLFISEDEDKQNYAAFQKAVFERLLEKANAGDANIQYAVSNCYVAGWGVERSFREAVNWCRKAAEQGHERAQMKFDKPEPQQ